MIRPSKTQPSQDLKRAFIATSQTIAIGDAIIASSTASTSKQVITAANTTGVILGIVVGLEGANGKVLEKNSVTTTDATSVQAVYIPSSLPVEYVADLSAASETTTGSSGYGYFNLSTSAAGTVLESSYVVSTGTAGQFYSLGLYEGDASKVKVIINKVI